MANINDVLSTLNEIALKNVIDVYLPTLQRSVKFLPLTTKQQKEFYSCIKDNTLYETKFVLLSHGIIVQNCQEDIVDSLTLVDKIVILLSLRKNALGSTVTTDNGTANFDNCLEYSKTITVPGNEIIKTDSLEIEIGIPTIREQYEMEYELRGDLTDPGLTLDEAISDVIVNNICLFIKSIKVIKENEVIDLQYSTFTFKNRLTIIENLPSNTLNELQAYLDKFDVIRSGLLHAETGPESVEEITISADFFLNK